MADISEKISSMINSLVGTDIQTTVRTLSSGAVSVDLWSGDRFAVLDGTSDGQRGLSGNVEEAAGYGGYEAMPLD
jgi:hypothetical protein